MVEIFENFENGLGAWSLRTVGAFSGVPLDYYNAYNVTFDVPDSINQEGLLSAIKDRDVEQAVSSPMYQSIAGIREFELRAYFSFNYSGESSQPKLFGDLYVDDGGVNERTPSYAGANPVNMFGFTIEYDIDAGNAAHEIRIQSIKAGVPTTVATINPSLLDMPVVSDAYIHVGIALVVSSTTVKLYADYNNNDTWLLIFSGANDSYIGFDLDKLALNMSGRESGDYSAGEVVMVDSLRFATGTDILDYESNVFGLTLGNATIESISAVSPLGPYGDAKIIVKSYQNSDYDVIEANVGRVVAIAETQYGGVIFRGSVAIVNIIDEHLMEIKIKSHARLASDINCNYNSKQDEGTLKYLYDNKNENLDGNYTDWGAFGYPFIARRKNNKSTILHPISFETTYTNVGSDTGVIANITDEGAGVVLVAENTDVGFQISSHIIEFTIVVYIKSGISFTQANLNLIVTPFVDYIQKYNDMPELFIFDYDAVAYESIYEFTQEEADNRDEVTLDINLVFATSGIFSNYLEVEGVENSSGYTKHNLKLKLFSGLGDSGQDQPPKMTYRFLHIDFIPNADQSPGIGYGKLHDDSNTTTHVFDETPLWDLFHFPVADGLGSGDFFDIGQWMNTVIANVFVASAYPVGYSTNITDDDILPDALNRIETRLADFFKELSKLLNVVDYYDPFDNTQYLITPDNVISTGLTLDKSDSESGLRGMRHYLDANRLKSRLIAKGKSLSVSATLSPDFVWQISSLLTAIEFDNNLNTEGQLDSLVTKFAPRYENANRRMNIPLDYTTPPQDYSGIRLGQSVEWKYPTVASPILNYSSGNLGEVMITQLHYLMSEATGFKEIITLTLQRRYD